MREAKDAMEGRSVHMGGMGGFLKEVVGGETAFGWRSVRVFLTERRREWYGRQVLDRRACEYRVPGDVTMGNDSGVSLEAKKSDTDPCKG